MGILADRQQVVALVKHFGPVVAMQQADAAGVSRAILRRLHDRGEIRRLSKAAFAPSEIFDAATDWEQFRLRSIAFALGSQEGTYLTGESAAVIHNLPLLGPPPELPTAIRHGSPHIGHNLSIYGRVRHGFLPLAHRTSRDGVALVSPAFCAVDLARHLGPRSGLVAADKVLHFGVDREVMAALTIAMVSYPGIAEAQWVIEHADGRAESPLETLGRYAFISAGLAAPLSNVWILAGGLWFRVDHLIPETGVILEADGALKYDNRDDASRLIANDRHRERLLRRLTYGLGRYTWIHADRHPGVVIARAREAAQLRPARPVPTGWTLTSPFTSPALRNVPFWGLA